MCRCLFIGVAFPTILASLVYGPGQPLLTFGQFTFKGGGFCVAKDGGIAFQHKVNTVHIAFCITPCPCVYTIPHFVQNNRVTVGWVFNGTSTSLAQKKTAQSTVFKCYRLFSCFLMVFRLFPLSVPQFRWLFQFPLFQQLLPSLFLQLLPLLPPFLQVCNRLT